MEENNQATQKNQTYYYSTLSGAELDAALQQVGQAGQQALQAEKSALRAEAAAAEAEAFVSQNLGYTKPEANGRFAPAIYVTGHGEAVAFSDGAVGPTKKLVLRGRTRQASVPAPTGPVTLDNAGAEDGLALLLLGKNRILPRDPGTETALGITRTRYADGTCRIQGTATGNVIFHDPYVAVAGAPHVLTGCPQGGSASGYMLYVEDLLTYNDYGSGVTFTPRSTGLQQVYIRVAKGATVDVTFRPMIRPAGADSAYQSPGLQAVTLPVEGGLAGIPMQPACEKHNYTDPTGQKWFADEIDLARMAYIQRCYTVTFDGTESWQLDSAGDPNIGAADMLILKDFDVGASENGQCAYMLCSHFRTVPQAMGDKPGICMDSAATENGNAICVHWDAYRNDLEGWKAWLAQQAAAGTPVTVMLGRKTPVEMPLPENILQGQSELLSNDGENLFYPGGAFGEITYMADTKRYIDGKLAALAAN